MRSRSTHDLAMAQKENPLRWFSEFYRDFIGFYKKTPTGTTGFGLFFLLPIGSFRHPFLIHCHFVSSCESKASTSTLRRYLSTPKPQVPLWLWTGRKKKHKT